MEIAKVIVDVPVKETDRPFDYLVPESMREWIEIGSRVGVPFGHRTVQGFVIDLVPRTGEESFKLKQIQELLDIVPPLSKDLVELAEWMSGRYASNRILSLQVMVPTALKGKAERYISLGDALDGQMAGAQPDDEVLFVWGEESTTEKVQQDIIRFVKSRGQVPLQQLSRKYPNHAALIKKLLLGGVLLESQAIKDKLNKKTMKSVDLAVDIAAAQEALASFPAKAQRQKEILAFCWK